MSFVTWWRVDVLPEALAQVARLPHGVQVDVDRVLERRLAINPRDPRWALPLREEWRGFWRAYAGHRVGPRATVYRRD